ncbi:TIR domain-containing protein [Thalassospira xiamenensis]|uniref:TIR domain-containing protein n=1 Tax=Thalassospira xiamenensis TaxID=220697 RepID=UPI003AA8EC9C
MEKKKDYELCHFSADIFNEIVEFVDSVDSDKSVSGNNHFRLSVNYDGARWLHDSLSEFLSDYRKTSEDSEFAYSRYYQQTGFPEKRFSIYVYFKSYFSCTTVSVEACSRDLIEKTFEIFERRLQDSKISPPKKNKENPTIFIGHGHGLSWRDLKDHLHDQHGYSIEAYETGARAGHTIRDILHDMASRSNFALLVMTGDDIMQGEVQRARQNVVHEIGLFQGRLGFNRAIVLLENGVEEFSNLYGIQQIRFDKNNIRSTFGDVLATLRREFG